MATVTEVLWMLSGDTTVMYSLLEDVPELVALAGKVASGDASYEQLLKLSYEYF